MPLTPAYDAESEWGGTEGFFNVWPRHHRVCRHPFYIARTRTITVADHPPAAALDGRDARRPRQLRAGRAALLPECAGHQRQHARARLPATEPQPHQRGLSGRADQIRSVTVRPIANAARGCAIMATARQREATPWIADGFSD